MNYSFVFFLNSALLGVGLAMDAFSVSLANGLHEPRMRMKKMCGIAGTFGAFQAFMPMTGWLCVHTIEIYSMDCADPSLLYRRLHADQWYPGNR